MGKHDEMTRYAFISHMEDYMKKLLTDPLKADTDEFLKGHGIDGPRAMEILTKRTDPNDENSSIVIKKAAIRDNGVDDNGNRLKDTFTVKYRIPRKDYTKKMRNLYISLFESNIIEDCPIIEEGAWGYGILDNDSALDYQSDTTKAYINKVIKDIKTSTDSQSKWAKVGVLVDFLKKYKSDELQVTDTYSYAIDFAKDTLRELFNDEGFIASWDDEAKIKSSLKKAFNDVAVLRYNEDIMISGEKEPENQPERGEVSIKPVPGDGKLMEDGEGAICSGGATNADSSGQYTTPLFGGPIRKKTMYITQEQADYIGKMLNEEGDGSMSTPPVDSRIGHFGYTAPIGDGKANKGNDFYKEANDHKDMMKKSWQGAVKENSIHIKKENEGKFTATKERTGKSTEELTHSKNPLTRKRAIFAQNAKKWNKK